jgi:hypothetical protein
MSRIMKLVCLILLTFVALHSVARAGEIVSTPSATKVAHTTELPEFDKIRIYALSEQPHEGDDGFPIRPDENRVCKILAEVEVTGKQAAKICEIWRTLINDPSQAFCHGPPYGFRFYKGDEMVFETSMCWTCHNFYGPDENGKQVWYSFKTNK